MLREVAQELYLYAYPIVLMEITRRQQTNFAEPGKRGAPMNQFLHSPKFPPAKFKGVVRANHDTLYSNFWGDVSKEPLILSVPDTGDRYYLLQFLDLWTDVFESLGTRTTGNGAAEFALVGPGWDGDLPAHVTAIRAPTPHFWVIGRTQTNGKADYPNVHEIQAGFRLAALSRWRSGGPAPEGPVHDDVDMATPPVKQIRSLEAGEYFEWFAQLANQHPAHFNDYPLLHRVEMVTGWKPGESLGFAALPNAVRTALAEVVETARTRFPGGAISQGSLVNGWHSANEGLGTYGTNYRARAAVARMGLGANVPEDSTYPTAYVDEHGHKLDSANRYVLHFERDQLPPVNAFWSVTIYNRDSFFIENEIDRYALGDRDPMRYNHDGSLDIFIQAQRPDEHQVPNWLPSDPQGGPFSLTARLYWPKPEALGGSWHMPPVRRID